MANTERQLHLGLNMLYGGSHAAAWRASFANPLGSLDFAEWIRIAQIAEKGKFDALFLGDVLTFFYAIEAGPPMAFDPIVMLTVLSQHTSHIGMIGTVSTTYEEPFNLARRLASMDFASGGRIAWNIITSQDPRTAANFTANGFEAKERRYDRAAEFVDVVQGLWDSWDDTALVGDQAAGVFADPQKIRAIDHHGSFFDVAGPGIVPRSPQGCPILFQAGGSPAGLDLAARRAEAIFAALASLDHAQAFAADIRQRLVKYGRPTDAIRIMPGLVYTLGSTETEARKRNAELDEMLGDARRLWLAGILGANPDDIQLDKQIPDKYLSKNSGPVISTGGRNTVVEFARRERVSVRELLLRISAFHRQVIGTPEQLADTMEDWFRSGAVDGFNMMPDEMVSGLEIFVEHVVPLLQKRGIFRKEYVGTTFRDHLGLAKPVPQRSKQPEKKQGDAVSAFNAYTRYSSPVSTTN